jgi:hypothetical protein
MLWRSNMVSFTPPANALTLFHDALAVVTTLRRELASRSHQPNRQRLYCASNPSLAQAGGAIAKRAEAGG